MNYIPSASMKNDFGIQVEMPKAQEKSLSDLSFADALKAAYKSEKRFDEPKKTGETGERPAAKTEKNELKAEETDALAKSDDSAKSDAVERNGGENKIQEKKSEDSEKVAKGEKSDIEETDETETASLAEDSAKNAGNAAAVQQNGAAVKSQRIAKAEKSDARETASVRLSSAKGAKVESDAEFIEENAKSDARKIRQIDLTAGEVADSTPSLAEVAAAYGEDDVQVLEGAQASALNARKTEKSDKKSGILEGISVTDLRNQKNAEDAENPKIQQKSAKISAVVEENATSAKKSAKSQKTEKSSGESKNQNLAQNFQVQQKNQKVATQAELKNAYEQDVQESSQVTMELSARAAQNITSSSQQSASAGGSTFQQMLQNAVQHSAPEFVKAGSIVLKDGNKGTINLIMRPESLGNVKISLSLSDKTISGQITVASKEAYDAFKESIDSIRQAFAESGFDTGAFDLSFSNQQNFAQDGGNAGQGAFGSQDAVAGVERSYGDLVASGSDSGEGEYFSDSEGHVNIVA